MIDSVRSKDTTLTKAPPRTERIFSDDELWYFRTREQAQIGPFRYRSEAQSSLERFLRELQEQLHEQLL
ncbi:MAG: DUF6316 family protein [Gammaproteobacteria bacterium]|nr:hypothetical protein [Pseudomonadales bacterium]MCP5346362.1 hypothetical protein [Pseudomonadales bacterium]